MARFADLAMPVLKQIALELVKCRSPKQPNPLDLLPLRLVHSRFAPQLLYYILRTSKVTADKAITSIPWRQRAGHWSEAGRFLFILRKQERRTYVRHLTFTLAGTEGAGSGNRMVKLHQCIKLLTYVGPYIRHLRLTGDTTGESPWEWQPAVSDIAFPRLQRLELSSYYLALLSSILLSSPHLKTLSLGRDPIWADKTFKACPTYANECHNMPPLPKLELLSIDHASNYGVQSILRKARIRAKHIHLTVSAWEVSGLFALADGVRTWPVFKQVEEVTIFADHPANRRLVVVINGLREANIPFKLEREILHFPLLDERPV